MNLQEILNNVYASLGKDQYGGYVTPESYNEAIRYVNLEQINDLLKVFEEKREITDDLLPFVKTIGDSGSVPLRQDNFGYVDIPEDYWYYIRSHFSTFEAEDCDTAVSQLRPIEFLNQADFGYRIGTEILKPTVKRPIAAIQNNKWLVQPVTNQPIVFTYLRKPADPNYDYDIINGEIVYLPPGTFHADGSPSTSVEFEYPDSVHLNLVQLIVKYFSINIRSQFNLQTLEINKGQTGAVSRGIPTYGNL
jgi:hypothetical protein